MPKRIASLVAAAAVLYLTLPFASRGMEVVPNRPNIVVFYLDDVSPHDGSLWNDPTRTPAIFDTFIAHGTEFTNAIAEDPLCCPARANFLTGLHTHNNRVVQNDARLFDPSVHVGESLKDAGYATMWIGKYLNNNFRLTEEQWLEHDAGWTYLDVFKGVNGYFYNYTLHTRSGDVLYEREPSDHSTQMVADRAIEHFRQTDAATPIFAVLSPYNLHGPNLPLPEHVDDPRCADMPPWNPPNYNEADVSDKPAAIQALPLQPDLDGWPMVGYCEEMLGVDKLVQRVTDELAALGRLDNTLLVFSADNGMAWGQHRMGQSKRMPFTTPVPLYMSWPARLGTNPRTIPDHVSNIDFAPTFCDAQVADCTVGPFRSGQPGPDGVSLYPLLDPDGPADSLGRDALLEAQLDPGGSDPNGTGGVTWTGLRTTSIHPLGLWHYVEYSTGERELYDLRPLPDGDPFELENRASDPTFADVVTALSTRLAELRREGRPAGGSNMRPDGAIALSASGRYKLNDFYRRSPVQEQTQKLSGALANTTYDYFARIENDAAVADTIGVTGVSSGSTRIITKYFVNGFDYTTAIRYGTYTVDLGPGASITVVVRFKVAPGALVGDQRKAILTLRSRTNTTKVDVLRAVIVR